MQPSSSTTTTSTWPRASYGRAGPRPRCRTSSTFPWPEPDYWRVLPEADSRRAPRRAARERRRRLPHRPLAPELPSLVRRHRRGRGELRRLHSRIRRPPGLRRPAIRSPSTRASSTSSASSRRARARAAAHGATAREAHPPRRPHRPVEERRSRLPRLRAAPRGQPRAARAGRHARAARPDSPGHPRVRRVPRRDPADGARRQRPLSDASAGCRSSSGSRTTSSTSVAAYKQYDVLLVNAIFDGLNLIAKEAPLVNERDGVLVLSENAGAHEELAEWAVTRQSLRHRRAGGRHSRRAGDAGGTSDDGGSRRFGLMSASTTSQSGSRRSSLISTDARPRSRRVVTELLAPRRRGRCADGRRSATSRCPGGARVRVPRLEMTPETTRRSAASLPKGDALTTAQIAGVMAAKRTSELIPLCHPLPLTDDRRACCHHRQRRGHHDDR